jgi:hypothetical protein
MASSVGMTIGGALFQLTISRPEHSVLSNWGFQMSSLLRAASLFALIAVGAVSILPKFDLSETAFDETDTPTIQTILTTKAAPFRQCIPVGAPSMDVAQMPKPRVRSLFPAYTAKRSESRPFWALCSLRC